MDNQNKNIEDILEAVNFIKDNAASKEDLAVLEAKMATKDELRDFRDEVLTHIDNLAKLVRDFQIELLAMQSRIECVELKVDRIFDYLKIEA